MLTFYHFLGELLRRPSERMERLTPWVLGVIGGIILLIMLYAWWTAPLV
jgi:hypothetical protein